MKSRNFKFALMAGFVGLASFVVTSCTDSDTAQETQKTEDGISFVVSDIQNIAEPTLPKTKAPFMQLLQLHFRVMLVRD